MAARNTKPLKLPKQDQRVESGPVRFGDDWPGIFLRGDNAMALSFQLSVAASMLKDAGQPLMAANLEAWIDTLEECNVKTNQPKT